MTRSEAGGIISMYNENQFNEIFYKANTTSSGTHNKRENKSVHTPKTANTPKNVENSKHTKNMSPHQTKKEHQNLFSFRCWNCGSVLDRASGLGLASSSGRSVRSTTVACDKIPLILVMVKFSPAVLFLLSIVFCIEIFGRKRC